MDSHTAEAPPPEKACLGCFRALIAGAIDEIKAVMGDKADLVMQTIDLHVQRFFVQALQFDPLQLSLEAE